MFQQISFLPDIALSVAYLVSHADGLSMKECTRGWPSDLKKELPALRQHWELLAGGSGKKFKSQDLLKFKSYLGPLDLSVATKQMNLRTDFCRDFFLTRLTGAVNFMRKRRSMGCVETFPSLPEVQVHILFPGAVSVCQPVDIQRERQDRFAVTDFVFPGLLTDAQQKFPVCVSLLFRLAESFHWSVQGNRGTSCRDEDLGSLRRVVLGDALAAAVEVQWLSEDNGDLDSWMKHLAID